MSVSPDIMSGETDIKEKMEPIGTNAKTTCIHVRITDKLIDEYLHLVPAEVQGWLHQMI